MSEIPVRPPAIARGEAPSASDIDGLYAPIRDDLDRLEAELDRLSAGSHPFIREAAAYVVRSSGKRLRPALLILSARMSGYRGWDHLLLSALVEVIHTASLVHDDIIDNADLRRGRAASHLRWGSQVTVLLGDFLYVKALHLALDFKDDRIVRCLARSSARMIEGVLMECALARDPATTEADYMEIVASKTAALFEAGCSIGGILGGLPPDAIDALARFGAGVGTTFQIVDDLLDFTGDPGDLGKPVLSDLAEGRITLPLIAALRRAAPDRRERIAALIRDGALPPEARAEILSFVTSNGAVDETRRLAAARIEAALPCLDAFPDSVYKESLRGLAAFILKRTY
jgi:octaprenyl-diphosphate synthase